MRFLLLLVCIAYSNRANHTDPPKGPAIDHTESGKRRTFRRGYRETAPWGMEFADRGNIANKIRNKPRRNGESALPTNAARKYAAVIALSAYNAMPVSDISAILRGDETINTEIRHSSQTP